MVGKNHELGIMAVKCILKILYKDKSQPPPKKYHPHLYREPPPIIIFFSTPTLLEHFKNLQAPPL